MGRRNALELSGTAFTTHNFAFGYNDRSELETAERWQGTQQNDHTGTPFQWVFDYDNIGNRDWFKLDGDATGTVYTANDLNQYDDTTPQGGSQEYLCYDADGNLVQDAKSTSACGTDNGLFKYVWDAENRLIEIAPVSPSDGDIKLVFDYDYMSRRVRKRAVERDETLNNNEGDWKATANTDQKFIYDQWNVVMVLDGNDSNDIDRKYTWGLDMSGQAGNATVSGIHGAGGIGGLLSAWDDTSGSARLYWYFYDGNGNVVQVLEYDDTNDTLNTTPVAHYEYDPYGQLITSTGGYKASNPFRFSTKWIDDELAAASQTGAVGEEGLYYYGYRYYSPGMGRWVNRDPIGEEGGSNMYGFTQNNPIGQIDLLGLVRQMCKICCYKTLREYSAGPGAGGMPTFRKKYEYREAPCYVVKSPDYGADQVCKNWGFEGAALMVECEGGLKACASRIKKEVSDKWGATKSDDYLHCVAACRIVGECDSSIFAVTVGGFLRECKYEWADGASNDFWDDNLDNFDGAGLGSICSGTGPLIQTCCEAGCAAAGK